MFSRFNSWTGRFIDSLFFLEPERTARFHLPVLISFLAVGVLFQGLFFAARLGQVAHLYVFTLSLLVAVMYCFRPTVWLLRYLDRAQS